MSKSCPTPCNCGKGFPTKDIKGNPVIWCTGMCNVLIKTALIIGLLFLASQAFSQTNPPSPYRKPTTSIIEHMTHWKTASERHSTSAYIAIDHTMLTITIDDYPIKYPVLSLEDTGDVIKIITNAEPLAGEQQPPRYRWYYVRSTHRLVSVDAGITFY